MKGPGREEAQGLIPAGLYFGFFGFSTVLFQSVCSFEKAAVQKESVFCGKTPLQSSKMNFWISKKYFGKIA